MNKGVILGGSVATRIASPATGKKATAFLALAFFFNYYIMPDSTTLCVLIGRECDRLLYESK
jgi:hypothetical protein